MNTSTMKLQSAIVRPQPWMKVSIPRTSYPKDGRAGRTSGAKPLKSLPRISARIEQERAPCLQNAAAKQMVFSQPMHPPKRHHTYKEYLYFEDNSPTKHEYINGDIIAMTGGSPDHAGISAAVCTELGIQLRGKPCRVYTSDLRIRIDAVNVATYPD